MLVFHTCKALKNFLANHQELSIGFVPTMGAIHDGHLSLVKKSLDQNDLTVVSIFVNPIQFDDINDLDNYPRTEEQDLTKLKNLGTDVVFLPKPIEMYPNGLDEDLEFEDPIFEILEGKTRPRHYQGVSIIIKKLLELVKPNIAYFGQKDYQQILVIKKLVKFYKLKVKINTQETIRQKDGLALSSRNVHLSGQNRDLALILPKTLIEIENQIITELKKLKTNQNYKKEFLKKLSKLEKQAQEKIKQIKENKIRLDYLVIRDGQTLDEIKEINPKITIVVLGAIKIGKIRLIDNVVVEGKIIG